MNTLRQPTQGHICSIVDMARRGELLQLHRINLTGADEDDSEKMRTEIIASAISAAGNLGFPIFVVEYHDDDDIAINHLLNLFEAMRSSGKATTDQVANWRRQLIVAVK